MTLQQIMYFQRVARSGSFTKAARACFVSQTAISRQISALEEELHVTLLERDTAHVKLTLAGEYFFQQVNELTARLEEVVTRTQTIAQEHKGTIKAESDRRSTRFIVTLPLHHAAH